MNIFDIIIVVCLAISVILGIKDGAIRQAGTLAAIVIALIVARSYGSYAASLLKITGEYAHIWGYIIVVILCLICAGAVTTLLRNIISAVGLRPLDRFLGGVLAFIKCALILSLIFSLFNILNGAFPLVNKSYVDSSKLYKPIVSTSSYILPAIYWAGDQLPNDKDE